MYRVARMFVWLPALALLPSLAVGQAKAPAKVDEAALRPKLLAAQYVEGKLTTLDLDDDKKVVLTYTHVTETKKPKAAAAYKKYADAVNAYNAALGRRDTSLEQIEKLKGEVDSAIKDAFDVEEIPVKFELKVTDKTPIRFSAIPTNPDGTAKKTGYTAKLSDLNKTNKVQVYFDKAKIKKGDKGEDTVYPVDKIIIVLPKPEDDFKPILLK